MSDVAMNPPVSGSQEAYGVAGAVPVAGRGNSLVLAVPPSPAYATAVLAAAVGRAEIGGPRPILVVVPEGSFEAWARVTGRAAAQAGRVAAAGAFPSRAAHHLASGRVDLLLTTLATATELLRRSTLRVDGLGALVVAWPELELSEEAFIPLFADLPRETQRIVITADPAATAPLVERHAWRAPVVGPLGTAPAGPALPRLRAAAARWDDRLAALGAVADLLDADQLAVWTADGADHPAILERLAGRGVTALPMAGDLPSGMATVFYDAPPPELLGQVSPERAVALVSPGAERYYARVVGRVEPMTLPGPLDQAEQAVLADRRAIVARLQAGLDRGAYATVAPLLERWSGAEIAVALQSLWAESRTRAPAPAPMSAPRPAAPKVWINLGRKDGATLGEILAFVTIDLGIPRTGMGKLDLKETFTLIEFSGEDDARRAVDKLAGASFKGRRIAARIDRGRDRERGRSA